jgi:hypothetical protein
VTKKFLMMLSLLFAVGLIAAGCGGDDDDTTSTPTETTETTEETTETGATGATDVGSAEEAVDACLAQLDAFPAEISDDVRTEIEELCQNTEEVSVEEGQQIAEDVCTLLVEDALPEGPQQDQGVEACKSAGDSLAP